MKRRVFAGFMIFVLLFNIHVAANAQAAFVAKPFTGYVNQAVAGTIVKYAVRRGFAANDPRITATMASVGKVVDAGISGGAAAELVLTVAGAPVWGTAALAIGAVGAIGFGAYKLYQVLATDPVTGQQVQTVKIVDTTKSLDLQNAAPFTLTKSGLLTGAGIKVSTTTSSTGAVQLVSYRNPSCDPTLSSQCAALPSSTSAYFLTMDTVSGYPYNTPDEYLYIQWVLTCGTVANCTKQWTVAPTIDVNGKWSGTYKITWPSGSTGQAVSINRRSDVNGGIGAYYGKTLGDAFDQLPATAHNVVADPAMMADFVTQSMIKAASKEGYNGLPVSVTDSVSPADFSAWQAENSSKPINMSSFETETMPSGATSVVISPQSTAANPYGVDTSALNPASNVNVVNSPTVNVGNVVKLDLGPDPGVPLPVLENTPTVDSILSPIFDLFPTLRAFKMPEHQAVCPKAELSLFGGTQAFDAHCGVLEDVRPVVAAVMAFVWAFVALRVTLSA